MCLYWLYKAAAATTTMYGSFIYLLLLLLLYFSTHLSHLQFCEFINSNSKQLVGQQNDFSLLLFLLNFQTTNCIRACIYIPTQPYTHIIILTQIQFICIWIVHVFLSSADSTQRSSHRWSACRWDKNNIFCLLSHPLFCPKFLSKFQSAPTTTHHSIPCKIEPKQ